MQTTHLDAHHRPVDLAGLFLCNVYFKHKVRGDGGQPDLPPDSSESQRITAQKMETRSDGVSVHRRRNEAVAAGGMDAPLDAHCGRPVPDQRQLVAFMGKGMRPLSRSPGRPRLGRQRRQLDVGVELCVRSPSRLFPSHRSSWIRQTVGAHR